MSQFLIYDIMVFGKWTYDANLLIEENTSQLRLSSDRQEPLLLWLKKIHSDTFAKPTVYNNKLNLLEFKK